MSMSAFRITSDDRLAGGLRLMLAVIFLMTGPMKLLIPELTEAFAGQLTAAQLPLPGLSMQVIPYLELFLGIVLLIGLHTRAASIVVIGIMLVATYVHLAVDDPALFPLQPAAPIIPIAVIVMSLYLLWRGAGAWSLDLKAVRRGAGHRGGRQ